MKALRKMHPGEGGVQLCDVPIPEPAADEIRVKVAYVGICGTDMHIISDEYDANMPVTMGHEYSGVVDAVGADVKDYAPGDRVISMTVGYACGKCKCCRQGNELKCPERKSIGSGMDGAMAEYVVVKADRAFHIPEGVSMKIAALSEPVSTVTRSVIEVSNIRASDYVYVSGPGVMGQIVAQLAKLSGAHVTVGGTNVDSERLALAKKLGADVTVDVTQCDIEKKALEITHGEGFDVVFECAGVRPSADTCLNVLRKMGQYVQVCLFGKSIPFDMDAALIGEKHIVNSFAADRSSFEITLRLLEQGKLQLDDLVSAEYPISDWKKAIEQTQEKKDFKILLVPGV
jgi:L-iditol 2-dehydrogenase